MRANTASRSERCATAHSTATVAGFAASLSRPLDRGFRRTAGPHSAAARFLSRCPIRTRFRPHCPAISPRFRYAGEPGCVEAERGC